MTRVEQIADYVGRFWEEHGYGPTVREIGQAVGLRSSSTVQVHVEHAITQGLLVAGEPQDGHRYGYRDGMGKGKSRTLRLPASQVVRRSQFEAVQSQVRQLHSELTEALERLAQYENGAQRSP